MSIRGLDGVAAFLRVAERRSFRAAALDLGVSASAVSQAIRALEARVGVALVARSTRSVGLTEAGEKFLAHAAPAMADLAAGFEAARSLGDRPAGLLRLTVPRAVVGPVIEPVLAQFCAAHPEVEIEIVADLGFVDIVEAGFDAGIRLAESLDADMIGVRLTPPFRFCVVANPDYLEIHGTPKRPEDLASHRAIGFRQHSSGAIYRWEFNEGGREFDMAVPGQVIVNDEALVVSLALKGLGLSYVAEPIVAPHIAAGRLVPVLDPFWPESPGIFLYYPSRAQTLPKLRAFVEHMKRSREAIIAANSL
ncbi:LysR family transcriptional regulator [Pelagibacterium sp. H642]|uniref:LysR family transcriptional regulator n=1 Tax=Pelagibacterium sp. H642 TaxID=1881069 RepID=UPI00281565D8|nr:LysR family transcriptional regulator [Pelagibacterium sp. H642]WMT89301.1 LysR family transcriptional regulator [Pelagibacterium sp. H642]